MEGIILKNIDLTGISEEVQIQKVKEEKGEFAAAFVDYKYKNTTANRNHCIEEFWDMVQAHLGLLNMNGITAEEVMKAYPKHIKKLENRPRQKECKKCINKSDCRLYLTEHWDGEKEAESCKNYKESDN
jgi:phosphoribosyl-ATP pyrophosphohydrolase